MLRQAPLQLQLLGYTKLASVYIIAAAAAGMAKHAHATMATASPAPWEQDRFAISFWVDPIVPPARFDAEYKRHAAWGPCGASCQTDRQRHCTLQKNRKEKDTNASTCFEHILS